MLPNYSLLAKTKAKQPHPTQATPATRPLASSDARPPGTSNGPSRIRASFPLYTNCPSHLPTLQISLSSRSPSRTQTLHSGACSTLLMLGIIFPPSVSNLERYKRTLLVPTAEERGSASLARHWKKRRYGKPWERATRTVSNGSSSAQPSTFSSRFSHSSHLTRPLTWQPAVTRS